MYLSLGAAQRCAPNNYMHPGVITAHASLKSKSSPGVHFWNAILPPSRNTSISPKLDFLKPMPLVSCLNSIALPEWSYLLSLATNTQGYEIALKKGSANANAPTASERRTEPWLYGRRAEDIPDPIPQGGRYLVLPRADSLIP